MAKSKKAKPLKNTPEFSILQQRIRTSLASRDIQQACNQFLKVTDSFLQKIEIIEVKDIEELFDLIRPTLKWQKDVTKNLGKLSLLRQMAKVYEKNGNPESALKCYQELLTKYVSTITAKNFDQHITSVGHDFSSGLLIASNFKAYQPIIDLIHDRFCIERLPKGHKLFDLTLELKAKIARSDNFFKDSLMFELSRIEHVDQLEEQIKIHSLILQDSLKLGEKKVILNSCYRLVNIFNNKKYLMNDPELLDIYITALFYKAQETQQVQDWLDFHDFMTSPEAQLRIDSDETFRKMSQVSKEHLKVGDQFELLQEMQVSVQNARALFAKEKYSQAVDILVNLKRNLTRLETNQSTLKRTIEVSHLLAQCFCQLCKHDEALKLWHDIVLENIDKVLIKNETLDVNEVYKHICKCYIYHLNYYDEALDFITQNLGKNIPDYAMLMDYVKLLIFKGKTKKSLKVLKRYQLPGISKWCYVKDTIFVHMWQGHLNKAFGRLNQKQLEKLNTTESILSENSLVGMAFYFYGLRRTGQSMKAFRVLHHSSHIDTPISSLSGYYCQLEVGVCSGILTYAKEVFEPGNPYGICLLENFIYDIFYCIDRKDPKKVLMWLQKDLKKRERGNATLKRHQIKIQHFHNSIWITLQLRKKLKIKTTDIIFRKFDDN